ncbi:MAG TPA: RHS repeat-associated core domain-containing protein, partial [Candidatus Limnocylindrales bacterium]|nr:RHS repeat-associated core domain-containing protein [Candidatus Limnocylindrales bacterium]
YDLDSNRLSKTEAGTTSNATYDATGALKQVWQAGQGLPQFATYDAFGNLLADPETGLAAPTFGYDAANRLTGIDAAGSTNDTSFGFDALGRHLSRTINGTTETYEFLGTTETVTRIDAASDIASLVDDAGARLGTLSGSSVAWLMPDPHGSVAGQAQASALTTALRYDGYGQTIASAPTSLPAEARRWKYQGRLDIAPEGLAAPLYDFSARFYSPGLGSFTQLDPLQGSALDPLTLNRYLYAAANPATLIDPTGLRECEWDSCTGGTADKPDPGNQDAGSWSGGGGDGGGGSNTSGGSDGGTGSSNTGGGTGGTATGNSTAGGGEAPTYIGGIRVDANGVPYNADDAAYLEWLCISGADADRRAACDGARAFWELDGNPPLLAEGMEAAVVCSVPYLSIGCDLNDAADAAGGDPVAAGSVILSILGATKLKRLVCAVADRIKGIRRASDAIDGFSLDALSASGASQLHADGLTRAANSLNKHQGGLFPKVAGNVAQKNEAAQAVLDGILHAPGRRVVRKTAGSFVGGFEVIAPDGRMADFDKNGVFQYFGKKT